MVMDIVLCLMRQALEPSRWDTRATLENPGKRSSDSRSKDQITATFRKRTNAHHKGKRVQLSPGEETEDRSIGWRNLRTPLVGAVGNLIWEALRWFLSSVSFKYTCSKFELAAAAAAAEETDIKNNSTCERWILFSLSLSLFLPSISSLSFLLLRNLAFLLFPSPDTRHIIYHSSLASHGLRHHHQQ